MAKKVKISKKAKIAAEAAKLAKAEARAANAAIKAAKREAIAARKLARAERKVKLSAVATAAKIAAARRIIRKEGVYSATYWSLNGGGMLYRTKKTGIAVSPVLVGDLIDYGFLIRDYSPPAKAPKAISYSYCPLCEQRAR